MNSSRHRRARADEFDPPKHLRDLLNMAYDDKDEQYPIYRVKENYQVQCIATGNLFLFIFGEKMKFNKILFL